MAGEKKGAGKRKRGRAAGEKNIPPGNKKGGREIKKGSGVKSGARVARGDSRGAGVVPPFKKA